MGASTYRVPAESSVEEGCSKPRDAGDFVTATVWSVGGLAGFLSGSNSCIQDLRGACRHATPRLLHLSKAIRAGSGSDQPVAGIETSLRQPGKAANPTRTEGETGIARDVSCRRSRRN